jgi:group I intron endonuclease
MTKIYKLIDPRNNLVMYVGKTCMALKKRMYTHYYVARDGKTDKDYWIKELQILGYNPIIELIEEVDNSIWQEKERYWIAYYKSINPDILNICIGGSIGGVFLSLEKQQQVILLQSGIKSKPVYQLTKDYNIVKLHKSCKAASRDLNTPDTNIGTSARSVGKKSAKGFLWIYFDDYKKWQLSKPCDSYTKDYSYLNSEVSQYDKDGNFIKKWKSQTEAAETLNIKRQGITRVKCGERLSYKGFIWK